MRGSKQQTFDEPDGQALYACGQRAVQARCFHACISKVVRAFRVFALFKASWACGVLCGWVPGMASYKTPTTPVNTTLALHLYLYLRSSGPSLQHGPSNIAYRSNQPVCIA